MKGLLWLGIAVFTLTTARGQIVTGISKEHARHLWYVSYINDFGIGYLEWQYGELTVHRNGSSRPVYLELSTEEWLSEGVASRRTGSPLRGAEPKIGRRGRSRAFQYAPGSRLTFFRLWHAVNTSLESRRPTSSELTSQYTWADVRWTVSPGMVQDTMEVALALVDAESGERLWVFDSVGVRSGPSDAVCQRYGTSPDWCLHAVDLPDRFSGRQVAVEPLPYRYGPTPFGLGFMKRFSTFGMSALFENERDEVLNGHIPRSEDFDFSRTIDSVYSHHLRMHFAEAFLQDSCPPAILCLYALDPEHQNALNAFLASIRFRENDPECRSRAAADSAWWKSTLVGSTQRSEDHGTTVVRSSPGQLLASASSDTSLMVSITGVRSSAASYRLTTSEGFLISYGPIGALPAENVTISMQVSGLRPDVLTVVLDDGSVLSAILERIYPPAHDGGDR